MLFVYFFKKQGLGRGRTSLDFSSNFESVSAEMLEAIIKSHKTNTF